MRYVELFAGAGGMSLGLERAGLTCVAHAELADFPRRVLKHRWPDVPLYGDVSAVDGRKLVADHGPIDLLAGGSPCQDMSVAGKRAGLAGARSGLFYEQLRLWEETQATCLLWENVAGALSSNNGKDFAAVLSAIVGATVTVPRDGWGGDESGGGVAAGPTGVAAWRLLDAQWFGVPQRRLRVFVLGARAGGVDPAAVLLEPEGVLRHPPTRGEAGEGSARGAAPRPAAPFAWNEEVITSPVHRGGVTPEGASPTLTGGGRMSVAFDWQKGNDVTNVRPSTMNVSVEQTGTLQASKVPAVLAFDNRVQGDITAVAPCVTGSHGNHGMVLAFDINQIANPTHRTDYRVGRESPTLSAHNRIGCVTGEVTHALTHEGFDASEDGTGRGTPIVAYFDKQALGQYGESGLASTVSARDYKDATDLIVAPDIAHSLRAQAQPSHRADSDTYVASAGIPRRLLPVECERLMSWPDGWTDVPDDNGKPASDAVRYRACGNGVVSNVAEWIGVRLKAVA